MPACLPQVGAPQPAPRSVDCSRRLEPRISKSGSRAKVGMFEEPHHFTFSACATGKGLILLRMAMPEAWSLAMELATSCIYLSHMDLRTRRPLLGLVLLLFCRAPLPDRYVFVLLLLLLQADIRRRLCRGPLHRTCDALPSLRKHLHLVRLRCEASQPASQPHRLISLTLCLLTKAVPIRGNARPQRGKVRAVI
ncbi:hypothetical protein Mapa_000992 [Marchantia paleacea]|nr:hypothetical protein Mapa_000992 [Marchantia paleacea]